MGREYEIEPNTFYGINMASEYIRYEKNGNDLFVEFTKPGYYPDKDCEDITKYDPQIVFTCHVDMYTMKEQNRPIDKIKKKLGIAPKKVREDIFSYNNGLKIGGLSEHSIQLNTNQPEIEKIINRSYYQIMNQGRPMYEAEIQKNKELLAQQREADNVKKSYENGMRAQADDIRAAKTITEFMSGR